MINGDVLLFILERAIFKMQMGGEVHYTFLGGEWREILRGNLNYVEELKGVRGGLTIWLGSTVHDL